MLIQAEEIEILKGKILTVQIGTNYFSFKLVLPTINFLSCCNAEEIDEKNSYEKINSSWVKFDKKNEIFNESISGEETNDEKNENENNIINIDINKENTNINNFQNKSQIQKDIVEIEKEDVPKKEEENVNIIKIGANIIEANNTNNSNNFNNNDFAANMSTLKVNNVVNVSQIENVMNSIQEENKSEIENYNDNRRKGDINIDNKINNFDKNIKYNMKNYNEFKIKEN